MRRKPSTRTPTLLYVVALCFLAPLEAQERVTDDFVPVTDAMLRDPDPADWLMVHRTYDHHAYSPLDQINRENVGSPDIKVGPSPGRSDQELYDLGRMRLIHGFFWDLPEQCFLASVDGRLRRPSSGCGACSEAAKSHRKVLNR